MIKLNLSPSKKSTGIANIGGIDLSLINVKMMVIGLVLFFIPEPLLVSVYDGEISAARQEFQALDRSYKKLQRKVRSMRSIQKQVDALSAQEDKLAVKLETVKQIINKRQNPFLIMKYVADNIPEGVWLERISLDNSTFVLRGYAKTYKKIGTFISSLKSSIFFQNVNYKKPTQLDETYRGQKVEIFELTTDVVRFK